MNLNAFNDWFQSKVYHPIKETKQKTVLVSDRATYDTFLDELDRRLPTSWNKSKIIDGIAWWYRTRDEWLLTWNIKTNHQLIKHASKMYPSQKNKIPKICQCAKGIKV